MVAAKPASKAAVTVSKVSKDELRAQGEKLERANGLLRSKNREANRAAKVAAARIAELEGQVADLEKRAAAATTPVQPSETAIGTPVKSGRGKRRDRVIDPGDAVPPGVAVQQPAPPPDAEATKARENLEKHLRPG